MNMTLIGKSLGRYKLLEEIGSGGFATVYLGKDMDNNEPVAVKVLLDTLERDPTAVERMQREAQMLKKLPAHPNIIGLRESGYMDGSHYLVMDYVAGKDLSAVLDERGKLPVSEAVDVAIQVARALSAAAKAGIVHRDVKPENIRLLPDGLVKMMDFGIARDATTGRLTQTGMLAGTTRYVAPEIWKGRSPDKHSDIYALGCVLYEMLVGNPPFVGATPEAIMRGHIQARVDTYKLAQAGAPAGLCALIESTLGKEPSARPTADELARELAQYGSLAQAEASGGMGRGAGRVRRNVDDVRDEGRDETRINVIPPATGARKSPPREGDYRRGDNAGRFAGRWTGVAVVAAAAGIALALGLVIGALLAATLGLPWLIDGRAAQMGPTPAAAARDVANMLRGTPFAGEGALVGITGTVLPLDTPADSVASTEESPAITPLPPSNYSRVPGRLLPLFDQRKVDWFIDNEMPGLTYDPPLDSELGAKFWTRLDYDTPEEYGAGYVTVRAGETVSAAWTMDTPLPPGFYELFIYRPNYVRDFVAESVRYRVFLDDTELAPFDGSQYVNQQATRGTWVSIGGYVLERVGILNVHLDVESARPIAYEVDVDALGIARLDERKLLVFPPTATPPPTPTSTPTPPATPTLAPTALPTLAPSPTIRGAG